MDILSIWQSLHIGSLTSPVNTNAIEKSQVEMDTSLHHGIESCVVYDRTISHGNDHGKHWFYHILHNPETVTKQCSPIASFRCTWGASLPVRMGHYPSKCSVPFKIQWSFYVVVSLTRLHGSGNQLVEVGISLHTITSKDQHRWFVFLTLKLCAHVSSGAGIQRGDTVPWCEEEK